MSVVGFDVGNAASCVALARKRGIDVLMNKESKRETPAMVNFGEKMRFLGTDAAAKQPLSPQNTVHDLKMLLGKKFKDPQVQADIAKLPFTVTEGPDGGCLVTVMYMNERATFTPQQLVAMILVDLKKIIEVEGGISATDCCISVPTFYTEAERQAMLDAAQIAGLNCLRLINENTATALAYGIYKTDLPDNEPVHVAFVDVGHATTQVSIVALKKGQLQVKCHTWDRSLGGRDIDELMFDHFCAEIKEKQKLDVKSNKKASFKLRLACEKLKKILSANPEAPLNVECLMEDTDVRSAMTRELLETTMEPMLARLRGVLEQAVAECGLKLDDISSVELVGSCTRVPAVARVVEEVFKKGPSRTMNSKECVSRGACLQCAMLSPVFKVREFEVIDCCPYTVEFAWDKDGVVTKQTLFERNSAFPSAKMLTFMRPQPFAIEAHYTDKGLPPSFGTKIGEYQIGPFEVPAGTDKAKLKVKVRMNLHGLVSVESVQNIVEEEVEEPKDVKMEDAAAAPAADAAAAPAADAAAPMDTDAKAAAATAEKKKKVKKIDVKFAPTMGLGLSRKAVDDLFEKEGQMAASDKLQEETNEKKNALEGYVYNLRNKLYDAYAAYIKESDKESLVNALQAMEDWLYDEGEDTTKSVYIAKLEELQKLGGPVERRATEDATRGPAAEQLRSTCQTYLNMTAEGISQYAHISAEDKAQVATECNNALKWLDEKLALQKQLAKHDDPVLQTSDITKKRDTVERVCKPIMSKPAPPPPKPAAAPAPDAQPAPAEGPAPMESEAPADAMESDTPQASEGAAPEGQTMDLP